MPVRTRFAPSPTGYLHIGGVRTALFNWLFAKGQGGQFILRIDDTDAQRNVDEALAPILHGLRWVGLQWDEGPEVGGPFAPYYQSQRLDKYQAAVTKLLEVGAAYRDYAKTEELQAEREAAQAAGRPFVYSRRWRAETDADARRHEADGRQGVVRLLMPREGQFVLNDLVRGEVRIDWPSEQDHVIQRADGTCLYHLATVVDDHDMQISHVIRAEEHLSNTPRQVFIFEKLGYEIPQFAHLPFVAEPDSSTKLSKRKLAKYLQIPAFAELNNRSRKLFFERSDILEKLRNLGLIRDVSDWAIIEASNPLVVDFYEQIGFISDALVNYLLLLGWSLDDKSEEFTREEMIHSFSLERVNKSPARFDVEKLWAFQNRAMQRLSIPEKMVQIEKFLKFYGAPLNDPSPLVEEQYTKPYFERIVRAAGDRITVAGDILDYFYFALSNDVMPYDELAFSKRIAKPPHARELLMTYRKALESVQPFMAERLDQMTHDFVDTNAIKIGDIVHAVRVAVTGKAVGFGLFETLDLLGRERCLARIDRALQKAGDPPESVS